MDDGKRHHKKYSPPNGNDMPISALDDSSEHLIIEVI
jgi:hypothetical protein